MSQISLKLDFKNKNCLVIGMGKVGKRKADKLISAGAIVDVYDLRKIENYNQISNLENVSDYFLVVLATNDEKFNQNIEEKLNKTNVLINNATKHINNEVSFLDEFKEKDFEITLSCVDHFKRKEMKEKIRKLIND